MVESPISYTGSKYNLLPSLLPLFPQKSIFVDLFTGGGSIYMNIAGLYDKVIANDILKDIIEIHKNLQNKNFLKLAGQRTLEIKHSQDKFLELRDSYNSTPSADKLLSLIWTCNSNNMRFNKNGMFNQTWGKRSFNKNILKKWEHYSKQDYSNVEFTNKQFYDFQFTNEMFVYLDPPYSNTEAGYNTTWNENNDIKLLELIDSFIENNISFGLSGVINEKPNKVFEYIKDKNVKIHYFGDIYQKIAKIDRKNTEYFILKD